MMYAKDLGENVARDGPRGKPADKKHSSGHGGSGGWGLKASQRHGKDRKGSKRLP